jgi:hypothetical protein
VEGIPVIGLSTWRLERDGQKDDPILRAHDAKEAVAMALACIGRELSSRPMQA